MKIKNLRTDDSAVSPVIGVILMVAITVILAAVIGTFVLNLGNQVQSTAPQASFSFTEDSGDVIVTHDGGDSIQVSNLNVSVADSQPEKGWNNNEGEEVTAGSSMTVSPSDSETIRVIWTSDSGENSQTLAEYTVS